MSKILLHVDMDAFFASVELVHHPEWRGKPLVVGASPNERGVVSTCSYEARHFGIHSAMPSRTAYQLCPSAIFVKPNMELYQEASNRIFEIFSHYSPYVEGVSIDEAFLDITGSVHLFANKPSEILGNEARLSAAKRLGEALRAEVQKKCGVTCSVGIAPNRLLAKIGSETNKPNGLTIMPFDENAIAKLLAPKPIGIIWGVGKKTSETLLKFGIVTCGDVQREVGGIDGLKNEHGTNRLERILGHEAAKGIAQYVFGICDDSVHWEETPDKSVSREHTFNEDTSRRETIREKLLELVTEVGRKFRQKTRWAKTAKLKLRDSEFRTITRQLQFERPARDDIAFRHAALELFDREWTKTGGMEVRLIGFGVTNLQNTPYDGGQLLFADEKEKLREKHERLSETLDRLRDQGLMK